MAKDHETCNFSMPAREMCVCVCVYPSSSLGWRDGINGTVIQVHAVNLIDIRLGEDGSPF